MSNIAEANSKRFFLSLCCNHYCLRSIIKWNHQVNSRVTWICIVVFFSHLKVVILFCSLCSAPRASPSYDRAQWLPLLAIPYAIITLKSILDFGCRALPQRTVEKNMIVMYWVCYCHIWYASAENKRTKRGEKQ